MKAIAALLLVAGANAVQLSSDPMWGSADGYETRHYKGEGDFDDYDVPNFGRDSDIVTTLKNAGDAEKKLNHVWDPLAPKPDDPPRNYFVPHFGADHDIIDTKNSISVAEKQEDHKWVWKSKGYLDHTRNPVPPGSLPENQRLDDDMITSLKNSNDAETTTGQHWTGDGMYP